MKSKKLIIKNIVSIISLASLGYLLSKKCKCKEVVNQTQPCKEDNFTTGIFDDIKPRTSLHRCTLNPDMKYYAMYKANAQKYKEWEQKAKDRLEKEFIRNEISYAIARDTAKNIKRRFEKWEAVASIAVVEHDAGLISQYEAEKKIELPSEYARSPKYAKGTLCGKY